MPVTKGSTRRKEDGLKWLKMGTGYVVAPTASNSIIPLLERYGVPSSRIIGQVYSGKELPGVGTKYNGYQIVFFGVSTEEGLPTSIVFRDEKRITLDCWQIQIYWEDSEALQRRQAR